MSAADAAPPAAYDGLDRLPLGGVWRHGAGRGSLADRDPYTSETLLEIPHAGRDDLDAAYRAAAGAQRDWVTALPARRSAVFRRAAEIFEARKEEVIGWLIREAGSTRIKANLEWLSVHAVLLEAAAMPYGVTGRILPGDVPGKECRVYRKPVGVVAVISPWNWPLQLTARSLAPALAVGNAVVVKPASDTPVTGGLLLARIFEEAGLPSGLFSLVVGKGGEIGDAVVTHPIPRVVSFTGSAQVGRHIAKLAAEAEIIKRLELELGGNCPFVVLADADVEQAVAAAVFGKFLHQGQIGMIANRFIVEAQLHDRFVEALVERVRRLPAGDPNLAETVVGPLINRTQLDRLQAFLAEGRKAGARQRIGGEACGLVLPPHVFTEVTNDMTLAREELFGPVAPVIRAADEAQALALANDTTQGLSAAVFTGDLERGAQFARRLEVGMAHVNDHPVNDLPNNPFGGEKNSGIGRFGGKWAIDAFSTDQWITVQHQPRPLPTDQRARRDPSAGG